MSLYTVIQQSPKRLWIALFAFLAGDFVVSKWLLNDLLKGDLKILEILISAGLFILNFYGVFMVGSHVIGLIVLNRAHRSLNKNNAEITSRIAYVMPIYNEDPERVSQGVHCMWTSAKKAGLDKHSDYFVLSDTDQEQIKKNEERILSRVSNLFNPPTDTTGRLFYVRRPDRRGFKAGNIAHFLEQLGHKYDLMLVLDADSIVLGERVKRMAQRMEGNPRIGILQAAVVPIRGQTLFAQVWHFSLWRTAPIFVAGLSWLMQKQCVYWGHNAMIRIEPFKAHCALPLLPGDLPFGGSILSQDIVEASLIGRGGWDVVWDVDIGGSYDETPANIITYAKRDHRWCQGNFQHFWLMLSRRMPTSFRLYYLYGIMAYASSLLLLILVALSFFQVATQYQPSTVRIVPWMVFGLIPVLQLIPKLLGFCYWFRRNHSLSRQITSFFLDIALSSLVFPLLAYLHAKFVVAILCSQRVSWDSQNRNPNESIFWAQAARNFWLPSVLAAGTLAVSLFIAPTFTFHTFPLLVSFIFSIPIAVMTSSEKLSRAIYAKRWFTTPISQTDQEELGPLGKWQ